MLGLAVGGLLALVVLRTEDATARPDGLELAGAVLWRGVAYGLADGLLLSAFPILAVFAMFAGSRLRERALGTVAVGLAALVASLAMTAVYHLGYSRGAWWCTCPARSTCAHLLAARLVVAVDL